LSQTGGDHVAHDTRQPCWERPLPGTADDDSTAYDEVESERETSGPDPTAFRTDDTLTTSSMKSIYQLLEESKNQTL
jgi:hypothetical protein